MQQRELCFQTGPRFVRADRQLRWRKLLMYAKMILLVMLVVSSIPTGVSGRGRNGSRTIITPTAERQAIRSTHILYRPDRRGHVYGNTVRRRARDGR
jgi:hypothetical protein